MKISASIYSSKEKSLSNLVKELDEFHVDYFHIDCNDDLNVFEDIKNIRKKSKTPVDLHIISSCPEKFFQEIIDNKIELVTFQYENIKGEIKIPKEIKSQLGLAIVSETEVEVFEKYKDRFDFILFMTTTPGKSGGTFNKENLKKIREFRQKYPEKKIHVDGGVTADVSFVLRNMGVSLIVSGSYLVNADYVGLALHNLRSENVSSHILIGDFMIDISESPVLSGNFSFEDTLKSIENNNMGFTMVADAAGKLEGIITNADVRRGLLKNISDLKSIDVKSLINRNPVKANQNQTVSEMLAMVKQLKFPVLFLPVVDDAGKLTGTITFNNLIKGES